MEIEDPAKVPLLSVLSGQRFLLFKKHQSVKSQIHVDFLPPSQCVTEGILFGKDEQGFFFWDLQKDTFRIFLGSTPLKEGERVYLSEGTGLLRLRIQNCWFLMDLQKGILQPLKTHGAGVRTHNLYFDPARYRRIFWFFRLFRAFFSGKIKFLSGPSKIPLRLPSRRLRPLAIIKDLSIHVQPNEHVAVIGTSGCGKSTLLRLLSGYYEPMKGEVEYYTEQKNWFRPYLSPYQIPLTIGFVPQSDLLPDHLRLEEVVELKLKQRMVFSSRHPENPFEHIEMAGLSRARNTIVENLSGGQRRRLSVILEAMFSPNFLLLDEPFAGLDPKSIEAIRDYVGMLKGKTTVICSTHIFAPPESFDQLIVLEKGRLLLQGYIFKEENSTIVRTSEGNEFEWNDLLKRSYGGLGIREKMDKPS